MCRWLRVSRIAGRQGVHRRRWRHHQPAQSAATRRRGPGCDAVTMAAGRGCLQPGAMFHSDRASQGGLNWSSQHLDDGGVRWVLGPGRSRPRQKQVRAYRGQIASPGRPTVAWREDRVRFWAGIASGIKIEDACVEARVGAGRVPLVSPRWRGEPSTAGGGVGSLPVFRRAGAYRDLAYQKISAREIARRLGRDPSTISRELRRNASTATYHLDYKATTAQWHAERRARRPNEHAVAGLRSGAAVR